MPNYSTPFGRAGEVAGGAAGAGLGGAAGGILGAIGGVLDAPRQSVYNLARGIGRGISGEGSWDDALGALPGALGAGLTGGLALTGVGLPAAIGLGSILGGVSQLAGKSTGRSAFEAPEVSDLTGTEDFVPNLVVGALTDPLTFAGGFGGAAKGASMGERAGQAFGRDLERVAVGRPLGYGGGQEKLAGVLEQAMNRNVDPNALAPLMEHIKSVRANPAALAEIPPGATYAGHGMSTLALEHPGGGVVQLTPNGQGMPRLNVPEMLQSERSIVHGVPGADDAVRVEHSPRLDTFPHMNPPPGVDLPTWINEAELRQTQTEALKSKMLQEGMDLWDAHSGNVGWDPSGKIHVIDSGSINPEIVNPIIPAGKKYPTSTDVPLPVAADIQNAQPTRVQSLLMRLLGSDKAVQAELADALAKKSVQGSPIMDALLAQSQARVPGEISTAFSPRDLLRSDSPLQLVSPSSSQVSQRGPAIDRLMAALANVGQSPTFPIR